MKKVFCFLLTFLLVSTSSLAESFRVFDNADLFSEEEERILENRILKFRKENKIDFAVLTTDDFIAKDKQDLIAALFYQSMNFGIGKDKDGAVLYIDNNVGLGIVIPQGNMLVNEIMTTMDDIRYIANECFGYFSEWKFAEGALHGIEIVQSMIDRYWEGQLK